MKQTITDDLLPEKQEFVKPFICEICKEPILDGELQVWLQTKIKEFEDWDYLEDFKFHNTCWVNKMKSIRQRGQEDMKFLMEKGLVEAKRLFSS